MVPTAAARKKERPHPWRVVVKYKTRGKREERRRFRARKKKKELPRYLATTKFYARASNLCNFCFVKVISTFVITRLRMFMRFWEI